MKIGIDIDDQAEVFDRAGPFELFFSPASRVCLDRDPFTAF